jgi:hypothetical protein
MFDPQAYGAAAEIEPIAACGCSCGCSGGAGGGGGSGSGRE